jgi:hypothetical protein
VRIRVISCFTATSQRVHTNARFNECAKTDHESYVMA